MDEKPTAADFLYAFITENDYDKHVVEPYQSFYKDLVDKLEITNFVYYVTCQVITDPGGDLVLLYGLFTSDQQKHANQDTALPMMLMYLFTLGIISAGDARDKNIQTDDLRESMNDMIRQTTVPVHVNISHVDAKSEAVIMEAIQENVVLPFGSRTVDQDAINDFLVTDEKSDDSKASIFGQAYQEANISGNVTGIDMMVTADENDVNVFFTLKTGIFGVSTQNIPAMLKRLFTYGSLGEGDNDYMSKIMNIMQKYGGEIKTPKVVVREEKIETRRPRRPPSAVRRQGGAGGSGGAGIAAGLAVVLLSAAAGGLSW